MFDDIRKFFEKQIQTVDSSPDSRPNEDEIKLATAALMYEVASADNDLDDSEQQAIEALLAQAFDIGADDSQKLAQLARANAADATSLHAFTSVITRQWAYEDRSRVIEMMWQVALADGRLDDHEHHLMRKLASLLYIPHNAYIAAKIRAQKKLAEAATNSQASSRPVTTTTHPSNTTNALAPNDQ